MTFTKTTYARAGPLASLAFALAAALAIPHGSMVESATQIGVAIMANTPRPPRQKNAAAGEHRDKVGVIPLDWFGNDIPYDPNPNMKGHEELAKRIARDVAKAKADRR